MRVLIKDYNGADQLIAKSYSKLWGEINLTLQEMPLYIKDSDQKGIKGTQIFDPKGTNSHISDSLLSKQWSGKLPIPSQYQSMGTDIDFFKDEVLLEVQFSNYPFLLNNIIRSELFHGLKISFKDNKHIGLLIIITKSGSLPSSNSTLYFEQAQKQLDLLVAQGIFKIPVRLVGLSQEINQEISAFKTKYTSERYSRAVSERLECKVILGEKTKKGSRIKIITS